MGSIWLWHVPASSESDSSLDPGALWGLLDSLVDQESHLGYEGLHCQFGLLKLFLQLLVLTLLLIVLLHQSLLGSFLVFWARPLLFHLLRIVSCKVFGILLVRSNFGSQEVFFGL